MTVVTVGFVIRYGQASLNGVFAKIVESRVFARTRQMEALHEHQRRMLLDLSHNLQTPLSVLKTKVERLEQTTLHDGSAIGLGQTVDYLSTFVNEVLALADLEHSLTIEERGMFCLSNCLKSLLEECGIVAEAKGIRIGNFASQEVFLFGNAKRIGEAVTNLLSNSIKYMGDGAVKEIRISIFDTRDQCVIEVTDTGRGIPENELPHVFDRFYRGSARTYGEIPGTGLGLSIVKCVVEEHGGTVTFASEVGKGTIVTLSFPRATRARSQTHPS